MYHDDDDVPVLHDSITSNPLFLQRYRSSLQTGPARDITHQRQQHTITFRHLDTIILPFVYWKRYLWSRLAPPTNLVKWSKRSEGLFVCSLNIGLVNDSSLYGSDVLNRIEKIDSFRKIKSNQNIFFLNRNALPHTTNQAHMTTANNNNTNTHSLFCYWSTFNDTYNLHSLK